MSRLLARSFWRIDSKKAPGASRVLERTNTLNPWASPFVSTAPFCRIGRYIWACRGRLVSSASPHWFTCPTTPTIARGTRRFWPEIAVEFKNADMFADRVLAGEILLREARIDHRHAPGVLIVLVA